MQRKIHSRMKAWNDSEDRKLLMIMDREGGQGRVWAVRTCPSIALSSVPGS